MKDVPLIAKYTVSNNNETDFLTGIENYGEGIFINWSDEKINSFITEYLQEGKNKARITELKKRISENNMISSDKFSDVKHLTKMLLIHSFSHLIIKELEFLCGYSS